MIGGHFKTDIIKNLYYMILKQQKGYVRQMKNLYRVWILAALLPVFVLGGCAGKDADTGKAEGTGVSQEGVQSLPDGLVTQTAFEAHDMDGNVVTAEIFSESKLTMINVWATYCNPCLREMPELAELAQAYDEADFRLIGIISDVPENADQEVLDLAGDLIEQTGASYTHLLLNESLYRALLEEVAAVPTTFFFDENGTLLDTVVGAMDKSAWEEKINELLAER